MTSRHRDSIATSAGRFEARQLFKFPNETPSVFYALNHLREAFVTYEPLDEDEAIDYALAYVREVKRQHSK
jgi:hypothetical protein